MIFPKILHQPKYLLLDPRSQVRIVLQLCSVHLSVCHFTCLFIHPSVHLSICLSVILHVSSSILLSICSSIHLSVCLSFYMSLHSSLPLSICLSAFISISLHICRSIYLSVHLSTAHLLSVCPSICLSFHSNSVLVCLYACAYILPLPFVYINILVHLSVTVSIYLC